MNTPTGPVEDGSLDATDDEKLAGLVEQTKQDVAIGTITSAEVEHTLRQRLRDAGLQVSDDDFWRLVERAREV